MNCFTKGNCWSVHIRGNMEKTPSVVKNNASSRGPRPEGATTVEDSDAFNTRYRGATRRHCTFKFSRPARPNIARASLRSSHIYIFFLSIPLLSDRDFTIDKPALLLLRDRITEHGRTGEYRDQYIRVLFLGAAGRWWPVRTAMPPATTNCWASVRTRNDRNVGIRTESETEPVGSFRACPSLFGAETPSAGLR